MSLGVPLRPCPGVVKVPQSGLQLCCPALTEPSQGSSTSSQRLGWTASRPYLLLPMRGLSE